MARRTKLSELIFFSVQLCKYFRDCFITELVAIVIYNKCVYQRAIRFPTSRKTKISHQFPFFVFQFWKTTRKTKLAYTLNLSKGQLFSECAANGKRILKQILFPFSQKSNISTYFVRKVVFRCKKSKIDSPRCFFIELEFNNGCS